jgi:formylglycine-generating enzyme required for sulfatase activity
MIEASPSRCTPEQWTAEQAARAMGVVDEADGEAKADEDGAGEAAVSAVRAVGREQPNPRGGMRWVAGGAAIAVVATAAWWSGAGSGDSWEIPVHAGADGALIAGERTPSSGSGDFNSSNGSSHMKIQTTAAAALLGAAAGTFADTAGHRYADFSNARATIDVAGSAVYDPQTGYTAECRIWIDTPPTVAEARFPASIMFQHQFGVDHKWLAIHSGKATGLVVESSGGTWWDQGWLDSAQVVPLGRWVHIAYVISGRGVEQIYLDGKLSSSRTGDAQRRNGASMRLGSALMADQSRILDSFGGKIDWIRVSSVARYSGTAFTVPTEDELVPDAQTNLLVTFNGTSTDDAFVDQSPHHYALTAGVGVSGGTVPPIVPDCNGNGNDDRIEIAQGLLVDSNADAVPDICQCGSMPELPNCCIGDIFADGIVNGGDLGVLLSYWGPTTASAASRSCDLDNNNIVNGADLGMLLSNWGACITSTVPGWATMLEMAPDATIVTDPVLRAAIVATGRPWRVRDTGTGIEMLLMPPGAFEMGCTASDSYGCLGDEFPVHEVTLTQAFYLSRCEVTQAQWQARMGANPAYFSSANGQPGSDDRPVESVSWNDVQGFVTSTEMRLPTEAEWEYAYRAGTTKAYHGWPAKPEGTNADGEVGEIAWYIYNTCYADGCGTRPVGIKARNGFGLSDMTGNVSEWLADWYGEYTAGSQTDPVGPSGGSGRVVRGGCWFNSTPSFNVRVSMRFDVGAETTNYFIGFRVARNP